MSAAILALNAGSSSIKFGLFACSDQHEPKLLARGQIEDTDAEVRLRGEDAGGETLVEREWNPNSSHEKHGPHALLDWIEAKVGHEALVAVGHRIVHGGREFVAPVRLTDDVIDALGRLTPLAPLHQPRSLAPIRALREVRPHLLQIACFDTAFHHDLAPPVSRFALPRAYEAKGIRRYGFHGLSYEFIAGQLASLSQNFPTRRTVVAHLGNGASLCAMRNGQSVDTTMGFSALDGLVMGTRCGAIDPGILLYLQESEALSVSELEHLLYNECGLLGVSGISGNMRTLLSSKEPAASEAIDLFAFHVARETAAMANTLGGLECLVFTGGIGEHAHEVRRMICERLSWLGVALDWKENESQSCSISASDSAVDVRVIKTNEEMMIARHAWDLVQR